MKTPFSSKTLIALAVAVAVAAAYETGANEQPIPPPPATDGVLPAGIQPGSPVAEVVKLVQSGVDVDVIQTYISNCPSGFNLDADKIIVLTDAGLSSELINAMFAHDQAVKATFPSAVPPEPPANQQPESATEPPVVAEDTSASDGAAQAPQEITVNYFYNNLAPYGSWVALDGYGYCWRPNVTVYNSCWRPYCDRGRWVYTDCGWYWNSDCAWGATFHYGRWFCHPGFGWCWWPDTVWAPSWVTWRSCYNNYCGWAPLPPYTAYQQGIGFCYRGNNVAVNFGFGLGANSYTFVSYGNICQPHPRNHCLPQNQVNQVYHQSTVVNDYTYNDRHRIENRGISPTAFAGSTRHPIPTVPVASLNGSGRQNRGGWNHGDRHSGVPATVNPASQNVNGANPQPGVAAQNIGASISQPSSNIPRNHRLPFASPPPGGSRPTVANGGGQATPAHPTAQQPRQNGNPRRIDPPPRPVQANVPAANNLAVSAPAPAQGRHHNPMIANGNNRVQNPQPNRTHVVAAPVERPQMNQPVRTPPPARVAPAPVVSTGRPQMALNEPRPNVNHNSQPAPRNNAAPAAAASQPQSSGNNGYGRGPNWVVQNH
jgi:hypothetical protein